MNPSRLVIGFSVAIAGLLAVLLMGRSKPGTAAGRPLLVYCAAGLKVPVEEVAREYERRTGVPVQLQFGGSGLLLNNLQVVRRGDLFVAADSTFLDAGRANGLVDEILPLARMQAVIVTPRDNPKKLRTLQDLTQPGVQIAFANPDAAAIGFLCRQVLERSNAWTSLQPRIKVLKPTVNDVANDVKLGTVDAGIVWDAVAGTYPELAAHRDPTLESVTAGVGIGVLSFTGQPTAALRFARFLCARDAGLPVLASHGYTVAEGDAWSEHPEIVLYSGDVNRVAIEDTLRQFEEREGVSISRVYNGGDILTAQIQSGQRPDAYFAGDVSFMTPVHSYFQPSTVLSETRILILTQPGNPKGIRSLDDLAQAGLSLGIANEQQSALGILTRRLLDAENLSARILPNVRVRTPTADLLVNQMRAGGLDAALVYAANVSPVRGQLGIVELPQPLALVQQPFAVGRDSQNTRLMERLRERLRSTESRRHFEDLGFRWRDTASASASTR
ncbi:MAG: substrate-binding domain-containing protein [Verrucomicrobiae bacterium]|nr:substrate-binding domain-containing protein [Verrucomicrobiae bacterium]